MRSFISSKFAVIPTLAIASAFTFSAPVQAKLTPYTSAGQNLVYSSVSNITWIGDANLLGTMINTHGYDTVVNAIIATSPTVTDLPNVYGGDDGIYNLSASDFNNSNYGLTNWFGAKAFVGYLNNINYAGSSQWALPSAGINPLYGYGSPGSQFSELFYNELGGGPESAIPNTANFTNEQASAYWLDTEYATNPQYAWNFNTMMGIQNYNSKGNFRFSANNGQKYAWAVSPGQVASVPVPGAVWMFGSGLLGLLGLRRQRGKVQSSVGRQ